MRWPWRRAAVRVAGTPLLVNGMFYFTAYDNAWAMDARTGRVMWHYYRESTGEEPGKIIKASRMYGNWLYFETRDNFLVSLDAITGKQRWIMPVADPKQFYFSTMAPIVIGDHVIVGTGGDSLDIPGFFQGARSGNRRNSMDPLQHAARGRAWHRDLAE